MLACAAVAGSGCGKKKQKVVEGDGVRVRAAGEPSTSPSTNPSPSANPSPSTNPSTGDVASWPEWAPALAKQGASFAPVTAPAASYDAPVAAAGMDEFETLASAALERVAQRAGVAAPVLDVRLSALARSQAALPESEAGESRDVARFLLEHHGIFDQRVRFQGAGSNGSLADALASYDDDLLEVVNALKRGGVLRFGAGVGPTRGNGLRMLWVALSRDIMTLQRVPRMVATGAGFEVRGTLVPPLGDAALEVTGIDGQVSSAAVTHPTPEGFVATVTCPARPGRIVLEVLASDSSGPMVAGIFPVYCGMRPPTSVVVDQLEIGGYTDLADAERQVFTRLNADRAAANLPALTWSDDAAVLARAHSQDMATGGFFAHVSPTHGDFEARTATLSGRYKGENIGMGQSPAGIQSSLMGSPGHRSNILSSDFTEIGIGAASNADGLYITQIFYTP